MLSVSLVLLLLACNGSSHATTADMSPIADGEMAFYHGTINENLEVELTLTRKDKAIQGSYEYAAHREAIVLRGELLTDSSLRIDEDANGKLNGQFLLDDFGGLGHLNGKWKSVDGKVVS